MATGTSSKKKVSNPVLDSLKFAGIFIVSALLIGIFMFPLGQGGPETASAGKVGGEDVPFHRESQMAREIVRQQQFYEEFYGTIPTSIINSIYTNAFNQVALQMVLYRRALRYGIDASPGYVDDVIRSEFTTNSPEGRVFLEQAYQQQYQTAPRDEKLRIERLVRRNVLANSLSSDLFGGAQPTSMEIAEQYRIQNTKRRVRVLYADAAFQATTRSYPEQTLRAFFDEHNTNFIQFELAAIAVAGQGEARRQYDALKDNLSEFSNTAREVSIDTFTRENAGYIGFVTQYDLRDPVLFNTLLNTEDVNVLLEPVFYNGSYYVFWLQSVRAPQYEDVNVDYIFTAYIDINREALIAAEKEELIPTLTSLLTPETPLRTIAAEGGYAYFETEPFIFEQAGVVIDAESGESIPPAQDPVFFQTSFALPVNGRSGVISFSDGVGVIEVLDAQTPAPNATFDQTNVMRIAERLAREKQDRLQRAYIDVSFEEENVRFTLFDE